MTFTDNSISKQPSSFLRSFWLPVVSGVILSFAFPMMSFWPVAWIALVPLFILLQTIENRRNAFLAGFIFAFVFFAISIFWIRHVTFFGLLFVVCFESMFYGLLALLIWELFQKHYCGVCFWSNVRLYIAIPSLWVLVEWIRSEIPIMGFGWNLLGYSQTEMYSLLQTARWTGVYGVSFLVALGNSFLYMLYRLITHRGSAIHRFVIVGFLSLVTVVLLFFSFQSGKAQIMKELRGPIFRVALIQGNIPQESKWDRRLKNIIIEKHLKLSELAAFDGPDLIIWPEAAYPGYLNLERSPTFLEEITQINVPFLVGALTQESETDYYNSAYYIGREGSILNRYDKMALVPFGEYLPFRFLLFPLESLAYQLGVSDFSSGSELKTFEIPLGNGLDSSNDKSANKVKVGPLICFENVFPSFSRDLAWLGAQIIVVITNDAWFKKSSAPYQHLQPSILRAVETGRWVIHSANTGVSALISPKGIVVDQIKDKSGTDIFVTGGITRPIPVSTTETFYLKLGFLFPVLAFLLSFQGFMKRKKLK